MHHRIAARALCRSPAMAMAIVALAAIQTGKLCLLATFPANSVSIVRRFYTSGTLPNERRTNHKRSSFCAFVIFIVSCLVRSPSMRVCEEVSCPSFE